MNFHGIVNLQWWYFPAATVDIPVEKRGRLFGVGGYRIRSIAEETDIEVESVDDQKMSVFAPSQEAMDEAMEKIDAILNEEIKVGRLFKALSTLLMESILV